ncbi:39S ribosomal protein L52, mitochondrial [Nasonia vitripennis]|uniref:Large ribosomal subunit protein mL52 n=1 Tax=Nasonia vitripennis TaxID=7425 RepID=A0A7M7G741_NASVI|nr:39S ribosomal protein L52, mitochondrial [Nasonia vitripennis]
MASLSSTPFLQVSKVCHQVLRDFHVSTATCLNHKWRKERKLPSNPNSFGPLTNLPDYSFQDNRPVPYGTNQKKRIDQQREQFIKIKELTGQIDHAVKRHALLERQEEERRKQILDSKLKEKGSKLISSNVQASRDE